MINNKILNFFALFFLIITLLYLLTILDYGYSADNGLIVKYGTNNSDSTVISQEIKSKVNKYLNSIDLSNQDINTQLLEDLILEDKYIKNADVYLDVAGVINIYIYLREPYVRFINDNNIYYMDPEWIVLPLNLNVEENLLVLSGDLNKNNADNLFNVVSKIYKDEFLNNLIGGIHYEDNSGYILSTRLCNLGIQVGHELKLDFKKINMIKKFYNFFLDELDCFSCNEINMQYDNQVICVK
tara:strand:+ start:821 stop:1543 length:723 start_codon:yes stop_codon:yes gene_type:complete